MAIAQKHAFPPSFGGQTATARGALEKCVEGDLLRRRIVVQKLEMAVRILKEAVLCESDSLLSSRMPGSQTEDHCAVTNLEIVKASARTFGDEAFTLSQLVARVAETFPGFVLTRQTVVRRLFDLRQENHSVVKVVSVNLPSGHPVKKGRRFLYNYVGPPC